MALAFARQSGNQQAASPVALAAGWWMIPLTLTFSGSYSTGGEAFDLSSLFPAGKTIRRAIIAGTVRGLGAEVDNVNKKLKLFEVDVASNAVAEHSAAAYDADVTGATVDVLAFVQG